MSTNADIILQTEDGYKRIYLHWDGYPSHAYATLVQHYSDRDKVEKMIDLGNISSLDKSIACPEGHSFENRVDGYTTFYGRDRGDANQRATFYTNIKDAIDCRYSYLFTLTGEWKRV